MRGNERKNRVVSGLDFFMSVSHPGTWEHLLLKRPSLHCVVECARSYIQSLVLNLSMGHAFGYSPGKLKRICEVMKEKNRVVSGLDFFL